MFDYLVYIREKNFPHIWCSGCGVGTVFGAVLTAIRKSGLPLDDIAMVSGIGCTGRMAGCPFTILTLAWAPAKSLKARSGRCKNGG